MERNPNASFYALEISVEPGGAREWSLYALDSWQDFRKAVDWALSVETGDLYLTLWYGRNVVLRTYIDGAEVSSLNLLPFVTYQVEGYPTIGFDAQGKTTGVPREQIRKELLDKLTPSEGPPIEGILYSMDWSRIQPPPLTGNLLRPGQMTMTDDGELVGYGLNDLENGYHFAAWDSPDEDRGTETMDWEDQWFEGEEDE